MFRSIKSFILPQESTPGRGIITPYDQLQRAGVFTTVSKQILQRLAKAMTAKLKEERISCYEQICKKLKASNLQ